MIVSVGLDPEDVWLSGLRERLLVANLETMGDLEEFLASDRSVWDAILVGPRIPDPVRAVRALKTGLPDVLILVLAPPERAARLEHELLMTPMRGEAVRCVRLDESASCAIESHLTRVKLRRRHKQAIHHANLNVPTRPAPPFRLPVLVERFLDTTPSIAFLLAEDGSILHANRHARELLPGSVRGRLVDALPVEEKEALRALIEQADPRVPARLVLGGVVERVFDATAAHASPAPERVVTLVLLNDVTSLVQAERERERHAALQRSLLAAQSDLGVGIVLVEDGRVTYANDAHERITGYTLEELQQMPLFSNVAPEEREKVAQRHRDRARGKPAEETYETTLVRKDGERVLVEVGAKRLGESLATVAVLRDVTARKRMTRELEEARLQVAQMDKLASMGSLVGGLAHEIRTPLTAVMNHVSFLDILTRKALAAEDPRKVLDQFPAHVAGANDGIDRIRGLVRDLNRFLKAEAPRKVATTLSDPVAQATSLFQATQRGHIEVVMRLESKGLIEADPAQIQQIVINLLQNAAEASVSGATVRVITRDGDGWAEVVVEDEGVGIPDDLRGRMFEAFTTTKPGGTGLGLTIVRRLAEMHGGQLNVDSRVGAGTRFAIRFAASAPQVPRAA